MRCDHAFLRCLAKLEIPREYDRLLARPMEIGANDLSEAPFTNSSTSAGLSPYSATQKLSGNLGCNTATIASLIRLLHGAGNCKNLSPSTLKAQEIRG
jgi:hypothetical protein